MRDRKRGEEAPDSVSSAPESGAPPGGRDAAPEEATEEPEILSPEEYADRATRRVEASEDAEEGDEALALADADNPLRTPGELSTQPREKTQAQRSAAHTPRRP
jgi:hypothetical protein